MGFFLTKPEESAQLTLNPDWYNLAVRFIRHQQELQGRIMQSHDIRMPVTPVTPLAERRASYQTESNKCAKTTGEVEMEPRVVELETHLEYIRRDMEEVRGDVRSIKHRLAYSAGGTAVVLGLLGWIANSRFDQLVALLAR